MRARVVECDKMTASDIILSVRVLDSVQEKKFGMLMLLSQDVHIGYVDDAIACVWGLIPPSLLSDTGYLWLHVTSVVKEHQFLFIRQSQIAVQKMLETYACLIGEVEIGNDKAVKWLRWLGAEFDAPNLRTIPFKIWRK